MNLHPPAIFLARFAFHQSKRFAARYESYGPVVMGLELLCELPDGCPLAARETFDVEQQ